MPYIKRLPTIYRNPNLNLRLHMYSTHFPVLAAFPSLAARLVKLWWALHSLALTGLAGCIRPSALKHSAALLRASLKAHKIKGSDYKLLIYEPTSAAGNALAQLSKCWGCIANKTLLTVICLHVLLSYPHHIAGKLTRALCCYRKRIW